MKNNVLLTGGTGQLGSRILLDLLRERRRFGINDIYVLIRGDKPKVRLQRIIKLIAHKNTSVKKLLSNVKVFNGDVGLTNFGLSLKDYQFLKRNTSVLFHSAALADFQATLKAVRRVNVLGVKNILKFLDKAEQIEDFNYVSTAFVAGKYAGFFSEEDFDLKQEFNNPYEKSKFEAELLIRKHAVKNYTVRIFRPSIIVGDFNAGQTLNFQMFYQPIRLLAKEIYPAIPVYKENMLNLMPVDQASKMIVLMSSKKSNSFSVYHIVSNKSFRISHIVKVASEYFKFTPPKLVTLKEFRKIGLSPAYLNALKPYIPYFNFHANFKCNKTYQELSSLGYKFPTLDDQFLYRLFRFARNSKFKRTL